MHNDLIDFCLLHYFLPSKMEIKLLIDYTESDLHQSR